MTFFFLKFGGYEFCCVKLAIFFLGVPKNKLNQMFFPLSYPHANQKPSTEDDTEEV